MSQDWIDSGTDEDARASSVAAWRDMRADLDAGEFWADRIKGLRNEPARRARLAIENLPLPAAFREAAVATRALIREKRKAGEPFDEALGLLYWLAALRSFMLDYAPRLKEPGINVMEAIPGRGLRGLSYSYLELGYSELSLLNKTDIKWLQESWGEPRRHSTLNQLHRNIWDEYENRLIAEREDENRKFRDEMREILGETPRPKKQLPAGKTKSGCALVLAIPLLLTCMLLSWLVV